MKKMVKICFITVLVLSLAFNGYMVYYVYNAEEPAPSIMKLGFSNHNIEIYCERGENVEATEIDCNEPFFKIGNAELISKDELYLRTPEKEINLSQADSDAFVINSEGEILYQLINPEKVKAETVFATPSGKKYHSDSACAGRTAFEVSVETAEQFGRTPCNICLG